jgi:putative ABC transport system ATP-binding protein
VTSAAGPGEPALFLEGVAKGYREGERFHPVLTGVSLELPRGGSLALLGPSGSGKSTLLNLIGGMDAPDDGRVEVAGISVHDLSETERTLFRRRRIGFVFQLLNLVPTLTVEENLLLPLELGGGISPEARTRARELLKRVGLEDRMGSWPERLSGGEQQRVAVARAVVHGPELVLADEPTGNLDRETGGEVLALLEELRREAGTTLVVVTHSPEVAGTMERVLELRGGRLHPPAEARALPG